MCLYVQQKVKRAKTWEQFERLIYIHRNGSHPIMFYISHLHKMVFSGYCFVSLTQYSDKYSGTDLMF